LLVEPYTTDRSKYVIPAEDFAGWNMPAAEAGAGMMKEYEGFITEGAKLLAKDVPEMVEDAKWEITSGGISKSHVMGSINTAYSRNVPNMYKDDEVKSVLSADFKEWQDQARFHINYMVTYWEQDLLAHKHEWDSIDTSVRALMSSTTPYLTNSGNKAIQSASDFFAGPVAFIESNSFLYYPALTKDSVGGALEEGFYGAHQDVVAECAGAGSGKIETLEACAGVV
jgi:hypothetical protein